MSGHGDALAREVLGRVLVTPEATDRVARVAGQDDELGAAVRFRLRRARREQAAGWHDRAARSLWQVLDMTRGG